MKPVQQIEEYRRQFFIDISGFVANTSRTDAQMSRTGDFRADDDDRLLPLLRMRARGVIRNIYDDHHLVEQKHSNHFNPLQNQAYGLR